MIAPVLRSSTSNKIRIFIQDSSSATGAGLTGLVHNTASLSAYYLRDGDNTATQISLVTATVGTFTSGGFKEVDPTNMPGVYEIGLPNACFSLANSQGVFVHLKGAANMVPCLFRVPIVAYDPQNARRMGMTALPDADAEAAGGLFTRGTGAGQINQPANGRIDVDVKAISGDTTAADNEESFFDGTGYAGTNNVMPRVTLTDTVTTYTGNTPQTGDNFARIGANGSGLTGVGLSAAGIKAIWDQLLSATFAVGSLGEKFKAWLATLGADNKVSISADTHTAGVTVANITSKSGFSLAADQSAVTVGAVSGNVGGSVASVGANGITSSSIAADAINAASIKADAVTKIQNGLSTLAVSDLNTLRDALRGAGWTNETLVTLQAAIAAVAGDIDSLGTPLQSDDTRVDEAASVGPLIEAGAFTEEALANAPSGSVEIDEESALLVGQKVWEATGFGNAQEHEFEAGSAGNLLERLAPSSDDETVLVLPEPTVGFITAYIRCLDKHGDPVENAVLKFQIDPENAEGPGVAVPRAFTETSDAEGLLTAELLQNTTYYISDPNGPGGISTRVTTTDEAPLEIPLVLRR